MSAPDRGKKSRVRLASLAPRRPYFRLVRDAGHHSRAVPRAYDAASSSTRLRSAGPRAASSTASWSWFVLARAKPLHVRGGVAARKHVARGCSARSRAPTEPAPCICAPISARLRRIIEVYGRHGADAVDGLARSLAGAPRIGRRVLGMSPLCYWDHGEFCRRPRTMAITIWPPGGARRDEKPIEKGRPIEPWLGQATALSTVMSRCLQSEPW